MKKSRYSLFVVAVALVVIAIAACWLYAAPKTVAAGIGLALTAVAGMAITQDNAVAGYQGKVYISDDGGNYTEVAELKDVTLNITCDMLDRTTHANAAAGWKRKKPGLLDWSADFGEILVIDDSAQQKIYAAIVARTPVLFRFDPAGTASGAPRYSGQGYLKDWKEASPLSDISNISHTIEGDGPLTRAAQSGVAVAIAPATATAVHGSGTQTFTATVTGGGGDTDVSWMVVGGSNNGTITDAGLYTAPAAVPAPADVTIVAVSHKDPSMQATAVVTVS